VRCKDAGSARIRSDTGATEDAAARRPALPGDITAIVKRALNRGEERARVRAVVASLPKTGVDIARWAPSGMSLAIGFLLLGIAAASYGLARETSLFAIERVEIVGGPPEVRRHVRHALAPLEGRSLVGLNSSDVEAPLAAVPDVAGATYDRSFPHTLRVFVLAERPLLVLRRGDESWLVSVRGRVLRRLSPGTVAALPRLWVRRSVDTAAGSSLADPTALRGVRLLAAAAEALPARVRTVRFDGDDAFVILRNGVEVRLGGEHDVRLKLAVAATILPRLAEHETYLDVAVPARPVAGA
jgi:cell division protein FtsQ